MSQARILLVFSFEICRAEPRVLSSFSFLLLPLPLLQFLLLPNMNMEFQYFCYNKIINNYNLDAFCPFPALGRWGCTDCLHPRVREPDPAVEPEVQCSGGACSRGLIHPAHPRGGMVGAQCGGRGRRGRRRGPMGCSAPLPPGQPEEPASAQRAAARPCGVAGGVGGEEGSRGPP